MGPSNPDRAAPYFFIHVMKTGGTTFRWHVNHNFGPDERYPDLSVDPDPYLAKLSMQHLLSQPAERLDRIRIFTGHLPSVTVEHLDRPLTTMTLLRDPVERTISHLKQIEAVGPVRRSLEEVYEDPDVYLPLIRDHQARMFAFAPSDDIDGYYSLSLVIDDARFERACENLDRIDLVGFQDRYAEFEAALVDRYGWTLAPVDRLRTSEPVEVSDAFRRRIADDNQADVEFYRYACSRRERAAR
jgi:hypothetical protein